jgi:hypothetical protein
MLDSVPNLAHTNEVGSNAQTTAAAYPGPLAIEEHGGREPVLNWARSLDKEEHRITAIRSDAGSVRMAIRFPYYGPSTKVFRMSDPTLRVSGPRVSEPRTVDRFA